MSCNFADSQYGISLFGMISFGVLSGNVNCAWLSMLLSSSLLQAVPSRKNGNSKSNRFIAAEFLKVC